MGTIADPGRCRLYGILDLGYVRRADAARVVAAMIEGGVEIIQLRAKGHALSAIAKLTNELHALTRPSGVPLIVNDHAEIGKTILVEGVHVGQDDAPVAAVRETLGRACWVGKSTHSVAQALRAEEEGADYIGFGPLFATPTKPGYIPIGLNEIARVHAAVRLPIFCIGGIKLQNLPAVVAAGARRVVIVSGLLQAADIAQYAGAAKQLLKSKI